MSNAAFYDFLRHDITDKPMSEIMALAAKCTTRNRITEGGNLQSEVDASQALQRSPKLAKEGTTGGDQAKWEAAGFKFGEDKDGIFRNVDFPDGWTLQALEQDQRHLSLIDNSGQKRGGMFVKDTFYDRCANCHLSKRISISDASHVLPQYKGTRDEVAAYVITYAESGVNYPSQAVLLDAGVFKAPIEGEADDWPAHDAARKQAKEAATAWLTENYPDWEEVGAYWDISIPGGVFSQK